MIRKLRAKFTAAAMLSLLIVLAVLMGAINLYNYISIVRGADETLSMLSENRGRFPQWMTDLDPEFSGGRDGETNWYRPDRPERSDEQTDKRRFSPELPFESRYFSLVVTDDGETADAYIERIANEIGKNYAVRVVTNDSLIRLSALRSGVLRSSAGEFAAELDWVTQQIEEVLRRTNLGAHMTKLKDGKT